jgi:hypothetical protein
MSAEPAAAARRAFLASFDFPVTVMSCDFPIWTSPVVTRGYHGASTVSGREETNPSLSRLSLVNDFLHMEQARGIKAQANAIALRYAIRKSSRFSSNNMILGIFLMPPSLQVTIRHKAWQPYASR